jgi:hypothetical protein
MSKVYGPDDYKVDLAKNLPTQYGGFKVGDIVSLDGQPGFCVVSTTVFGADGVTVINRTTGAIKKVTGKDVLLDPSRIVLDPQ